jgi:glycosyltransferase involved in cell wall biosynthesis
VQLAHLRPVKQPFLLARAAALLPADSRVDILHIGAALQHGSRERALRCMQANTRYKWIAERPHGVTMRYLAKSDLLVLSSKLEGGANAICEALALDVPILCSRIPGSIGLLGADYPGCFAVGNASALARLLQKASEEPAFPRTLRAACRRRRKLVAPDRERAAWRQLLSRLSSTGS